MMSRIPGRFPLLSEKRTDVSRLVLPLLLMLQSGLSTAAGDPVAAPQPLTFVFGNEVWIPGWKFYDGRDWFALNCRERDCRLVPAELTVKPSSWRGHYDDRSTSGQTLTFRKLGDSPGEVAAWVRRNEELTWLARDRVATYYVHGLTAVMQEKKGTYEIVVKTPDGTSEYLAPVLIPPAGQNSGSSTYRDRDHIYLQLKAGGRQQLLSEPLAACYGELQLDYLRWSGDLDRDGKTDYLISYLDGATGTVKIYLSSFAREQDIVGLAGTAFTHPLDGECD